MRINLKTRISSLNDSQINKLNQLLLKSCKMLIGKKPKDPTCEADPLSRHYMGLYFPCKKRIVICTYFSNTIKTYIETYIHEYTHHMQKYVAREHKKYMKLELFDNPLEREAIRNEKKYLKAVWNYVKQEINETKTGSI